jgi:hypothetical protein
MVLRATEFEGATVSCLCGFGESKFGNSVSKELGHDVETQDHLEKESYGIYGMK